MHALQHALDITIQGLLTQLPAQLATAAIAATAAWARTTKKRRATARAKKNEVLKASAATPTAAPEPDRPMADPV
ncbi:hypothetical protein [Streptomyces sp. NBC_01497]|uniref:hypothetical protein n=1 Tax=Streptomyces sp. NBC_01497 TaxID=2903885 RepID=UPI002E3512E3|nr:hypothetical protein [Streptomyces sp. NBC_01497]